MPPVMCPLPPKGAPSMSLIQRRPEILQKCYVDSCQSMVWSSVARKRCDYCYRQRRAPYSAPKRKYTPRRVLVDDWESPEGLAKAEQVYQEALREIKARPRGEPDLRWYSPLHGLKGTGL